MSNFLIVGPQQWTFTMEHDTRPRTISAQDARQGEIILRSRASRWIFIAGLVAVVALALVLMVR
jgi:hypothetical protein